MSRHHTAGHLKTIERMCTSLFFLIILAVFCFAELIYLEPHRKKKLSHAEFDGRVFGFIDALFLDGFRYHCRAADLHNHARLWLDKAQANQDIILMHTAPNGHRWSAHTSTGEHAIFAVLCIIDYAKSTNNAELLSWAESMLSLANSVSHSYQHRY